MHASGRGLEPCRIALLSAALVLAACDRAADPAAPAASSAKGASPPASARRPEHAPLVDELVEIAGGSSLIGSTPGEAGRDPKLEPRTYEVELGPFQMDRLPFPNDPKSPPLVGVTRIEATKKCAARGARLCTELEWERACRGPGNDAFAGGAAWDARCAKQPGSCASGFDVLGMGAGIREWTASDVVPTEKGQAGGAAVRGAGAAELPPAHRCARRLRLDADTRAEDLGFRCCKGAANAAVVREPALGPTFEKPKLTAAKLEALFAADPATKSIAHDVKFFREPEAARTVVARGPGDEKGFSFTVTPLLWNPVAGAEYLLVAGRSGEKTSFVAAFHVLAKDQYRLASSFIMQDEPGPVAFAYSDYIRPRLHFSTCWGCPGETGKILHREPDTVAILQP